MSKITQPKGEVSSRADRPCGSVANVAWMALKCRSSDRRLGNHDKGVRDPDCPRTLGGEVAWSACLKSASRAVGEPEGAFGMCDESGHHIETSSGPVGCISITPQAMHRLGSPPMIMELPNSLSRDFLHGSGIRRIGLKPFEVERPRLESLHESNCP